MEMKKNLVIVIAFLAVSTLIKAQSLYPWNCNFSEEMFGDQDIKAIQSITLSPGFVYSANSSTFVASVIGYEGGEYTIYHDSLPSNRTLDSSLPVGSIDENYNVTQNGNAIYSIPIFCPPGTGGMRPQISLVYNSNIGFSLLGRGWFIQGISSIDRVGRDLFHDSEKDGIHLDSTDKFTLNGQRLMAIEGDYGDNETEYRTDIEGFSKVISYGYTGNGPANFIVITKDGMKMEFGNSDDSRIEAQGKNEVLKWYLNRIEDQSGNYIEYIYHEDNNSGEFWPQEIKYAGNDENNLSPYNSILFNYAKREDYRSSFISGSTISSGVLLSQILVKSENQLVRRYELNYFFDDESKLTEINEFNSVGEKFNSTLVDWYRKSIKISSDTSNTLGLTMDYILDFNGDGFMDFINYQENKHKLFIYLNNKNSFTFTLTDSLHLLDNLRSVTVGDLNGDLMDDIIIENVADSSQTHYYTPLLSDGIGFVGTGQNFTCSDDYPNIHIADFDGDGKCECILRYGSNYDFIRFSTEPYFDIISTTHQLPRETNEISICRQNTQILDFNGDGKKDLFVFGGTGRFLEFDHDSLKVAFSDSTIPLKSKFTLGDFNGDGNTDFLAGNGYEIYDKSGSLISANYQWKLYTSLGTSYMNQEIDFSNFSTSDNKNSFSSSDFNGDGKADIIICGTGRFEDTDRNIFVAISSNDTFRIDQYNIMLNGDQKIADFTGDGLPDIIDSYSYTFYDNENFNFVKSITNGFNREVRFNYKPLTDSTIYEKEHTGVYPITDYQGPVYVVASVIIPAGNNKEDTISIRYSGAKIHQRGRGFLGFRTVRVKNNISDLVVETNTELVSEYKIPMASHQIISTSSDTISITDFSNQVKEFSFNRIYPYAAEIVQKNLLQDITTATSFLYDDYGNPIQIEKDFDDEENVIVNNSYIAAGISTIPAKVDTSVTITTRSNQPSYTSTTVSTYNTKGKLASISTDPDSSNSVTTYYSYSNGFGLLTGINYSAPGLENRYDSLVYDEKGRFQISNINALSQNVSAEYNSYTGQIISSTDLNGHVTTFEYDGFGRLTQANSPNGKHMTNSLEWAGIDDPLNSVYYTLSEGDSTPSVKVFYDFLGRVILKQTEGFDGSKIDVKYVYNDNGTLQKESEPYLDSQGPEEWIEYSYDDYGRNTGIDSPLAHYSLSYTEDNGRTVTSINQSTSPNQVTSRTIDATGKIISASDAGGTITYEYYSSGLPKAITSPEGLVTSLSYDHFGNATSMSEGNIGSYAYKYNAFGELTLQIENGDTSTLAYDVLGRPTVLTEPEGTTTFTYDTRNNGLGKISEVAKPGGISERYDYDNYSRISAITESIDNQDFLESFLYNGNGQLSQLNYPSGFSVKYKYNNLGYLTEITTADSALWQAISMNERDQYTQFKTGSDLTTTHEFTHGLLTGIHTGSLQYYNYIYDYGSGNMMQRSDVNRNISESFSYDNLNRLTHSETYNQEQSVLSQNFSYNNNGNIDSTTLGGAYTYDQTHPHAVSMISNPSGLNDSTLQTIDYTSFNKVRQIIQGTKQLDITYGIDRNRIKTVFQDSASQLTKYFILGNYEIESGERNRELHYIAAPTGIAAIVQRSAGTDSVFYVLNDNLGSINVILNQNGGKVQEQSFDAYGRRRNPDDWTYNNLPGTFKFDRGFTGHEQLDQFGLINMNGRMYDPLAARFLSPDIMVQDPTSTQSFNRYAYCLNNPLRYVDPSGFYRMHNIWGVGYEIDVSDNSSISRYNTDYLASDGRGGDGGGGSSGGPCKYDPSSPTGYRDADGNPVSWQVALAVTNTYYYGNPNGGFYNTVNSGNNSTSTISIDIDIDLNLIVPRGLQNINWQWGHPHFNISFIHSTKLQNGIFDSNFLMDFYSRAANGEGDLKYHSTEIYSYEGTKRIFSEVNYSKNAGNHVRIEVTNLNVLGVQIDLADHTTYYLKGTPGFKQRIYTSDPYSFVLLPSQTKTFDFYRFVEEPYNWLFNINTGSAVAYVRVKFYSTYVPDK